MRYNNIRVRSNGYDLNRLSNMVATRAAVMLLGSCGAVVYVTWNGIPKTTGRNAVEPPRVFSAFWDPRRRTLTSSSNVEPSSTLAEEREGRLLKKIYDGTDGVYRDDDKWHTGNNTGRFATCKSIDQDDICRGFGADSCKKMADDEMYGCTQSSS